MIVKKLLFVVLLFAATMTLHQDVQAQPYDCSEFEEMCRIFEGGDTVYGPECGGDSPYTTARCWDEGQLEGVAWCCPDGHNCSNCAPHIYHWQCSNGECGGA